MRVARFKSELTWPEARTVGFVPTMGAFHEGHLSLMRAAKADCGFVVASLFVNPTQFGPSEDFHRYPRDEERDFALAREAGVDVMFAPSVEEVYPRKTTVVHVSRVTERWEGAHRPGHFDGVATVVAKLFNMVRPHFAYFGLKDFQQCAVLRRMVEDLDIPVALKLLPTIREPDGLPMSSRNVYLDATSRLRAPMLYEALRNCARRIRAHPADGTIAATATHQAISGLEEAGFKVDYLSLVDAQSLDPLEVPAPDSRVIVAASIGGVRLIDNCPVFEGIA